MANLSNSPFSSTSSSYRRRRNHDVYDVFLSFRGETRIQFANNLYSALVQAGIRTFRDDNVPRGEEIFPQLLRAIERSRFSVVVFSRNYASSRWCLDELVKIIECSQKTDQGVLPIFYDTDPSEVRKQIGSCSKAFDKHEEHFKEEMEKVNRRRDAVAQAANLPAWGLSNEAKYAGLIETIVNYVRYKLGYKTLHLARHPGQRRKRIEMARLKSGWTLLLTNLILEIASAVFDQLGCALVGMVLAFVALLLSTAELIHMARKGRMSTIVEYFGLVGAVWQCFYSTVEYAYARQKKDNPIKMCLLPSIFLSCVVISKLIKKSHIEQMNDGGNSTHKTMGKRRKRIEMAPSESGRTSAVSASAQEQNNVDMAQQRETLFTGEFERANDLTGAGIERPRYTPDDQDEVKKLKGSKCRDMVDFLKSGWTLLMTSLILEMASAVFDQLGYALVGMVLAFVALLVATADLIHMPRKERMSPSTTHSHGTKGKKPGGTIVEYFGLVGAVWQCVYSTVEYAYARQKKDNPIKMCLLPFLFLLCVVISKLKKKSHID